MVHPSASPSVKDISTLSERLEHLGDASLLLLHIRMQLIKQNGKGKKNSFRLANVIQLYYFCITIT